MMRKMLTVSMATLFNVPAMNVSELVWHTKMQMW
jgi:hypothetical protein